MTSPEREAKSPPRSNQRLTIITQAAPKTTDVLQADGWLELPIPNRLTAAYHIGRLLNQFEWCAQQVLFGRSRDGRMQLERTLGRLIGETYKLQEHPSFHAERFYNEMIDDYESYLCCEAAADAVLEGLSDSAPSGEYATPGERRRDLVISRVDPLLKELRTHICNCLNESEDWAFELGRVLDQGVRPPGLYRHVEARTAMRSGWYGGTPRGCQPDWVEVGTVVSYFQPGEIPPDSEWSYRLKAIATKFGVPSDFYDDVLAAYSEEITHNDQISSPLQLSGAVN